MATAWTTSTKGGSYSFDGYECYPSGISYGKPESVYVGTGGGAGYTYKAIDFAKLEVFFDTSGKISVKHKNDYEVELI